MQYTYLAGVLLLLYFAFMYLTERIWLKDRKKPLAPVEPVPVPKPPPVAPKTEGKGKGKKGKGR